ncbi:MAG: hypothetical protein AB7O65_02775 [Candidatus Korobacteraceae bacterium]
MSGTIFQAPSYDERRERRKKIILITVISLVVVGASLAYLFRFVGYERRVSTFFTALQAQDYETAYSVWMNDPEWKQHPEQHSRYRYNYFYRDWGPGGEWGLIRTFEVEGSTNSGGSGVVVRVRVNERAQRANIWVEKGDKTFSFSPYETIQ